MRRFLITTTAVLAGFSTSAIASPDYQGAAFQGRVTLGDSAGVDRELTPVLEGWVRDTVREARDEAAELAAIAREQGIPFQPVRHDIDHRVMFESPEIVSVLREDWAYEGGANGSLWLIPVNWDARADALIPIQSVLGDPEDSQQAYDRVAAMLRDATVRQVWGGHPAEWEGAIEAAVQPDPSYLSTFTFVPSTVPDRIGGMAWHFEPYVVAPGSEGAMSVVIPQEALRGLVAPEWRDLFAGQPAEIVNARFVTPEDSRLQTVLAHF